MGCSMPIESGFIYFPYAHVAGTPSDVGLAYEEVFIRTGDEARICAWYVPCQGAEATLLIFHGNAGNIGDRVELLRVYHDKWRVNQMIVDYRGYGKSSGKVSEHGTYEDGRAAVRYLASDKGVSAKSLILFGESLGSAVAVQTAMESPCAGLILESPFTSVRDMAEVHYPILGRLIPLSIRYDSIGKIGKFHVPLLILHGDRDAIVPYEQGKRLFGAANEPKTFFTVRDAGHNDILAWADESFHETVRKFIRDSVENRVGSPGL